MTRQVQALGIHPVKQHVVRRYMAVPRLRRLDCGLRRGSFELWQHFNRSHTSFLPCFWLSQQLSAAAAVGRRRIDVTGGRSFFRAYCTGLVSFARNIAGDIASVVRALQSELARHTGRNLASGAVEYGM